MALMKKVTRRENFVDLCEMDGTEFRNWWRAMVQKGVKGGYVLLDVYEDCIAVAYAETLKGVRAAIKWWESETDSECVLKCYWWSDNECRFVLV